MNPRGILRPTRERMQSFWAVVFWALSVMAPLWAAEKANIALSDGTVLKAARIVSIGKTSVAIVHEGGVVSVSPEEVPLDVLARAHMELPSPLRVGPTPQQPSSMAPPAEKEIVSNLRESRPEAPRTSPAANQAGPAERGPLAGEVKETRGWLKLLLSAAFDSPKTTIFVVGFVLCLALLIFAGQRPQSAHNATNAMAIIAAVVCLSSFVIYKLQNPPTEAERQAERSQNEYELLRGEWRQIEMRAAAAKERNDIKVVIALTADVESHNKRAAAWIAEKIELEKRRR